MFGERGFEGKIKAIQYARENGVPYLGICYGMQAAVVEYARHVAGVKEASSEEFGDESEWRVVEVQESQKQVLAEGRMGGSMRLGAYAAVLKKGSRVLDLYER